MACLAGGPAVAGAWTLGAGDGQLIAAGTFVRGERNLGARGRFAPRIAYRKADLPVLVEYGLTDWVTLIISPSLLHVRTGTDPAHSYGGPGYTDVGTRWVIWTNRTQVASFQAIARIPGARRTDHAAELGWTGIETEARLLWGTPFALGSWPAFFDAQVAYRTRTDGPADEIRLDLTLGARPHPRWLLLLQSFNAMSVGPATGVFEETRSHKLAASAAVDLGRWTLQAGILATVAGRNTLRERGFVTGVWYRF